MEITFAALAELKLENEHLLIRRYQADDFAALNAIFDSSLFTWFFSSYATCAEFVAEKMDSYRQQQLIMLVIIDKQQQTIIGTTSIYEISWRHRRLELGSTWLAQQWQGSMVNASFKYLLIDYLVTKCQFNRIQWKTDALNHKSRAAMLKLGLVYEGTLRRHAVTTSGRVRDSLVFSVTDQDWPQVKLVMDARIAAKTPGELK